MSNEDQLLLVVAYVFLAGLVALLARSQGRPPMTWFFLALGLSPLFAFLAAVLSPPPNDRDA